MFSIRLGEAKWNRIKIRDKKIRRYREKKTQNTGMLGHFPSETTLWILPVLLALHEKCTQKRTVTEPLYKEIYLQR